jgi:hypothetical protein
MDNSTTQSKWYDKTWLVIVLCIIFFPVGLYALWKNQSISKGWKIGVTVLIALIVIANLGDDKKASTSSNTASSNSTESSQNSDSKTTEADNAPTYAKIGDEITIEHFVYRVNGVRFAKSLGNEFAKQTADGIYLIVDLSLKNMDNEEHTLDNSMFKLTDASGTEFESSTDATTALEMDGKETLFLKQCNPKIQKQGLLAFEVPEKGVYDLHLSGGFWTGKTAVVKLTDK